MVVLYYNEQHPDGVDPIVHSTKQKEAKQTKEEKEEDDLCMLVILQKGQSFEKIATILGQTPTPTQVQNCYYHTIQASRSKGVKEYRNSLKITDEDNLCMLAGL